jgi:nucleoside-diphosphate-sugar epimerase
MVSRHAPECALVTGGAGFIGSHLVDALLARGDSVRVLDSLESQAHPGGRPAHLSKGAELLVQSSWRATFETPTQWDARSRG